MILFRLVIHLLFIYFFFKFSNISANDKVCDFDFNVKGLLDIYDKYNGNDVEENDNTNDCNNLKSLNSVKSFWSLKLKSLCTEKTSILDKHVLNNICSRKYNMPHVSINGLTYGDSVFKLEFVCAHFLYSNDKEIIKCVKNNSLKNHLDSIHIAFDLSISQHLLKQSDNVDFILNLKDIKTLNLVKNIIDDSLCKIHSSVHTILSLNDFNLLKALVGLCTKLGFHNHFIITNNIHPLFKPLYNDVQYSLNSLNFNLENNSLYYANYDYKLQIIKLSESEYTLYSDLSSTILKINKNNSYITWLGLKRDANIYDRKFDELYKLLDKIKYIERITFCYSKYTSKYYESNINHFIRYLPDNIKDIMQNNGNIFIYLINNLCKDIPSIHKCVKKVASLKGIYDNYFKNFMINFIYYNASCIFNCNSIDLAKLFDDKLWKLFIKYFSHSYLVNYKQKSNNNVASSGEYSELIKSYYTNYDYNYIHSGKWRKAYNLDDENAILNSSDNNIEYEFYNYTFIIPDLGSYGFLILKNEMNEDSICKIASFIEENGKKYVHINRTIMDFFNKHNNRVLLHDDEINEVNNNNNDHEINKDIHDIYNYLDNDNIHQKEEEDISDDAEISDEEKSHGEKSHLDNFNFFDDFLDDYKDDDGGFLNMVKNNNFLNKDKLLEHIYSGEDEEDEEETHSESEPFDVEKYKIQTKMGDVYPLKNVYDFKELQQVYEIHPDFNDSDSEIRSMFFRKELFGHEVFFTVKDVPTKITNFYKYYYEIKKKLNKLEKKDEEHYNMLIENSKNDPSVFSKMNINFKCSKNGIWPIRKTSGRWISDVLCEAYFAPQLIPNKYYYEKKKKGNNNNSDETEMNKYAIKEDTRLIGIEFEDKEPYRCAISYLADELKKTTIPVSSTLLLEMSIGFCILHGFKIIWIADSACDIHTNIYLRYNTVLEKNRSFYEPYFQLYGETRLVPNFEYIASGINIKNNIITSGVFKNKYNLISFPGIDLKFQIVMSKKVKDTIYNLTFDCHHWAYKGCSEYYPLMKKHKKYTSIKYDTITLNGDFMDEEKEEMYQCPFMHDKMFIELNKMFPKECTYGSRIGDCHRKIRKNIPCYDEKSCKYQIYIYKEFYKPRNHLNLLYEHFIKVSENLTRLARPYYLQSILALEHDIQVKKSNKHSTEHEDILLYILKNSVLYITWATSSEYWKRAIYVQDTNHYNSNSTSDDKNKELFCPVAYAHEFIRHIFVQYMRFPNI